MLSKKLSWYSKFFIFSKVEFHFILGIDFITVSSLENSKASLSIFNLDLTPSLKLISKNFSFILAVFINISLLKVVGSNSRCCVPLSKNSSPSTLSLNQKGCISFLIKPLLK